MERMVNVNRPVYTLEEFNKKYKSKEHRNSFLGSVKKRCTLNRSRKLISSYLPVVKVIRKYKLKEYIVGDLLAGLTVSFIHLPQGLAFGLVASLQPIYGLYTTFFPVLFYMMFGTSPYVSYGPTTNMAILTRTVVEREVIAFKASYELNSNTTFNTTDYGPSEEEILRVKVNAAAACSILSGLFLGILGFFRLGFLTSYLSASLIGGFTTAAAVFVASSQIENLFGITTESYSGVGGLVLSYIDLFRKLGQTKIAELLTSVICITILLLVKIGINERYKDKLKFPVPIDCILAVVATVISYFAKLEENFDVEIVGPIPSGFLEPSLPDLRNASSFIADAIVIALVSLAMTITFAKLTAKKHGNKIHESQELFSYGLSNILSGFFGCFPSANASSRTGILISLGAKTTLNGLVTVTVFVLIILVVGQLFEYLPRAVLASMIIISTKDLVLQYRNLPRIWKINKYDFAIWLLTNLAGILLNLYYGLIVGLLISVLLVVVQNQMQSGYQVILASSEDVLVRAGTHNMGSFIRIFKFPTNLYFATAQQFKRQIYNVIFSPDNFIKNQKNIPKMLNQITVGDSKEDTLSHAQNISAADFKPEYMAYKPECVIIDCSMISYIDMAGINVLQEVITEYSKFDICVYLTNVSGPPLKGLTNAGIFDTFPITNVFLDVFDALETAKCVVNSSHL